MGAFEDGDKADAGTLSATAPFIRRGEIQLWRLPSRHGRNLCLIAQDTDGGGSRASPEI